MQRKRTRIRIDNVMPRLLRKLQEEGESSRQSLREFARGIAAEEGLGYREYSYGFALTAMKAMAWA